MRDATQRLDTSGQPRSAAQPEARVAVRGTVAGLSAAEEVLLLERRTPDEPEVSQAVATILNDVRRRGDEALAEMALRFDGVSLETLEVPHPRCAAALATLDASLRRALQRAAANIERFHMAQIPEPVSLETEPGVRLTHRFVPLERVGVYAPGGRAAYPSSVLMGALAARAAGVGEVMVCSPPGPSGEPPDAVLAAAALAGVERVFALGGAGAVAAMAFGTATVPRCAAVVGPGNRWVIEAKRQVAGEVVIDSPAGPSELLVLAEGGPDPERLAAELVAQAEHDPDAAVAFVTTSPTLLAAVESALARQVAAAPRGEVVESALRARGAMLVAADLDEALAFAKAYAPEHLALYTRHPERDLAAVTTAGTVVLGEASSVAFGDYLTGANHVLPTTGAARYWSGLSALTFLRSWTVQDVTPAAARALATDTALLAEAEGLPGHAHAARLRGEQTEGPHPTEEVPGA